MALEEEPPMLSKLKINVVPPKSSVIKLVVVNDSMLVALSSGSLLRIDLRSADKIEGIFFFSLNNASSGLLMNEWYCFRIGLR
jgi:hypothetical protein